MKINHRDRSCPPPAGKLEGAQTLVTGAAGFIASRVCEKLL